jgi:hypothetical protein
MPSELHNCHQAWIHVEMAYWVERGLLTRSESWDLYYFVGTSKSKSLNLVYFLGD